jgi:hypothetical protein
MPIPNADSAYVSSEKLHDYLLNEKHPVGGSKARWFISLGYDPANIDVLEQDLLSLVRSSEDFSAKTSPFGIKYNVSGLIRTPKGVDVNFMTVWIVESPDDAPRLVTAYPGERP